MLPPGTKICSLLQLTAEKVTLIREEENGLYSLE